MMMMMIKMMMITLKMMDAYYYDYAYHLIFLISMMKQDLEAMQHHVEEETQRITL